MLNLMYHEKVKLIMLLGGMNSKNAEVLIRTGMRLSGRKATVQIFNKSAFTNWDNFLNLAKNPLM